MDSGNVETGGRCLQGWCLVSLAAMLPVSALATDYRPKPTTVREASIDGEWISASALSRVYLQGGDRVILECGQRYAPLRLRLRSSVAEGVYIGPVGNCEAGQAPEVDGREPLSWRADSQAGSRRSYATPGGVISQVFDGNIPLARARFPAARYLMMGPDSPIVDMQLKGFADLGSRDLNGARLHARSREWLIEEITITDAGGRLAVPLRYPLQAKAGFYLTGKAWMLGTEPSWAFDLSSQTLWVVSDHVGRLRATRQQALLQVDGQGGVTVAGTSFVAAGADALRIQVTGDVEIKGLQVRWAAENGVWVGGARKAVVVDSAIQATGRDAIFLLGVAQGEVRGNTISEAGMYLSPGQSQGAINAHGATSAVIEENVIERSAYIGIRFAGQATVRGNLVKESCLVLSDCGALYSWRRDHADNRGPVTVSGNAVIGVGEGGDTSVKLGVNDWFAGIYLDEWTRDVSVVRNLVAGANQSIYLHNAFGNQVQGNVLLGSRVAPLLDLVDERLKPELMSRLPELPNQIGSNTSLGLEERWRINSGSGKAWESGVTHIAQLGVRGPWWLSVVDAMRQACKPAGPSSPLPTSAPVAFIWLACTP